MKRVSKTFKVLAADKSLTVKNIYANIQQLGTIETMLKKTTLKTVIKSKCSSNMWKSATATSYTHGYCPKSQKLV